MSNPFEQDKPTPGPWKADNWPGYKTISGKGGVHVTDFVMPAYARRILACVNALQDMPTELLEEISGIDHPLARLAALSESTDRTGRNIMAEIIVTKGEAVADAVLAEAHASIDRVQAAQPNELPHDDRAEVLKGSSSA